MDSVAPVAISLLDRYSFWQITIKVLLAIILSEFLVKDKLKLKYLWNVLLLLSFFLMAVFSILVLFRLEGLHATVLQGHVMIGIITVWIGLYHGTRRLYYYTRCSPWKKKSRESCKA